MGTNFHQRERGFTLIELTMSIAASAIIMLTIMSLMGMTQREWTRGMDKAELISETTLAVDNLMAEVRSADVDSVTVSSNEDTLKVGGSVRFYADDAQSLLYQGPNRSFVYLEGMVLDFKATTPVVRAPGDTLHDAVKVTLLLKNDDVQDSTSVIIYPRAN